MKRWILQTVKEGWYLSVFEHTTMKEFFKRILTVYNILDLFELDQGTAIALYGKRSYNWIAIYLACLLKGVRLVILHPNVNKLEAVHIMLLTNTNHIFIDEDLMSEELGRNLFLQSLLSIDSLQVVYEKTNKSNFKVLAEIIVSSEQNQNIELKTIDDLFEDEKSNGSVITATSGTEFGFPKWVESNMESITDLIIKSANTGLYTSLDKVYSNVEFAESHYLSVLLPFVNGCILVGSKDDAEVIFEDTNSIEDMWKKNVNYLYGKPILSFVFSISWMKWFFKKVAVRKIKNYYGKKLEKLIIYNNVINEEILSILVGKLPIYTTYGSQETNQLVAVNDFSTKEKRLPNAVGTALPGMTFTTFEDQLEISGSTFFTRYVGDDNYTREVRFRDNYVTSDIGFIDSNNILFVYGRKSAIHLNEFKLPTQLDRLERIIKSIPYIQDVIFLSRGTKLILLVYPDQNFAETKGLGLLHLEELMKVYLKEININLDEPAYISKLVIVTDPLIKTHDGKICRYFYS